MFELKMALLAVITKYFEKRKISKIVKHLERKYFNKNIMDCSREYFEKLLNVPFLDLYVETGPKCNGNCPHCYGDCGPDKEGMFTPELLQTLMSQIDDTHIGRLQFTDGEPFLDPNNLMKILDVIGTQ